MTRRTKKHNLAKRRANHSRAVLKTYNVCVIHTDWGQSGLLNWRCIRPVLATPTIAAAVTNRMCWPLWRSCRTAATKFDLWAAMGRSSELSQQRRE